MNSCPHNDEYACFDCETEEHDRIHIEEVDGCRTCKYRTIRLSAAATPTKSRNTIPVGEPKNSWERGIAKDHRGVPYLDNGAVIPVKKFAANRSKYEEAIRRNKAGALTPTS